MARRPGERREQRAQHGRLPLRAQPPQEGAERLVRERGAQHREPARQEDEGHQALVVGRLVGRRAERGEPPAAAQVEPAVVEPRRPDGQRAARPAVGQGDGGARGAGRTAAPHAGHRAAGARRRRTGGDGAGGGRGVGRVEEEAGEARLSAGEYPPGADASRDRVRLAAGERAALGRRRRRAAGVALAGVARLGAPPKVDVQHPPGRGADPRRRRPVAPRPASLAQVAPLGRFRRGGGGGTVRRPSAERAGGTRRAADTRDVEQGKRAAPPRTQDARPSPEKSREEPFVLCLSLSPSGVVRSAPS